MSERAFDGLSKFSQNVLLVWEDEERQEARRRKMSKLMPDFVVDALREGQRRLQRRRSHDSGINRRSLPSLPSAFSPSAVSKRSVSAAGSHAAPLTGLRSNSAPFEPSQDPLLEETISGAGHVVEEGSAEAPLLFSSDGPMDWSTSFHHAHYEAKKRERIRRLDHLRLTREAREKDEALFDEEHREQRLRMTHARALDDITATQDRLTRALQQLQEHEDAVRRCGLQRVHDNVHPSLLQQCGDTMPLKGEAVKLLPVIIVEEVFRGYHLVCPHELWSWSDAVGHIVDVKPLRRSLRHTANASGASASTVPPAAVARSLAVTPHTTQSGRLTPHAVKPTSAPAETAVRSSDDFQVIVRFENLTQGHGQAKLFELFASCLELAVDSRSISAPTVVTSDGQYMELVSLNVAMDIVGDVAAVTHKASWVCPRHIQRTHTFVDVGLVVPVADNLTLIGVSIDVGDSKLRTVVLDETDGGELVKKCSQARAFRTQQHIQRQQQLQQQKPGDVSAMAHPFFAAEEVLDPLKFVSDEASSSIQATGLRALGVWQDVFETEDISCAETKGTSPGRADLAPGQSSTVPSSSFVSESGETGDQHRSVHGTLIPLKQLKVSELVHVHLVYRVEGTQAQRTAFQFSPNHPGVAVAVRQEAVVDFSFPCTYPDVCLNHAVHRSFSDIADFTACVVGANPKKTVVSSSPRTQLESSAAVHPSYTKSSTAVSSYRRSELWRNTPIRVQVSSQGTAPSTTGIPDAEITSFHEPQPQMQLDFFVVTASTPLIDRQDCCVRRLVSALIDMRSAISPSMREHTDEAAEYAQDRSVDSCSLPVEATYRAVLELMDTLDSDDMVTISILSNTGWSMLDPASQHENIDSLTPRTGRRSLGCSQQQLASRTPRSARSGSDLLTGGSRSHRSSGPWWRKSTLEDPSKNFKERLLQYMHSCGRIGGSGDTVAQPMTAPGLWLKHHHHLQSLMHPEGGKDDLRECFLFTATTMSDEMQHSVALQVHAAAHANARMHVAVGYSPPPIARPQRSTDRRHACSTVADPSDSTFVFWRAVAHKTKGTFTPLYLESPSLLKRLIAMTTATGRCVSSDVDVYAPGSSDVVLLTPLLNVPSGGIITAVGYASYGGTVAGAPANTAARSPSSETSPLESVTVTLKLSVMKKVVKRTPLLKLPSGAISNLFATRASEIEMAVAWYSRILTAALERRHAQYLTDGAHHTPLPPIAPFTNTSPKFFDVTEVACQLQQALHHGPFDEAMAVELLTEGVVSPTKSVSSNTFGASAKSTSNLHFTGHSAKLYLYNQLVSSSTIAAGGAGPRSMLSERPGTSSQYHPAALLPPCLLSQTLGNSFRFWRDFCKQQCGSQLLEMGIFAECPTTLSDVITKQRQLRRLSTDRQPSALLHWLLEQRALLDRNIASVVSEENAVRGETEYEEWSEFIDAARAFHANNWQVQAASLEHRRSVLMTEEEERQTRSATVDEEHEAWSAFLSRIDAVRSMLRRHNKRVAEARAALTYQEEDARAAMESRVDAIHGVIRIALRSQPPATSDDVSTILKTLDDFSEEVDVVELLCGALAAWSRISLHSQLFGQAGGVMRLKRMVHRYETSSRVVELCMHVLFHMSQVHVNQGKLEQSGVASDLLSAMHQHMSDEDLQYRAVQCLAGVAKLTQTFRLVLLKSPVGLAEVIRMFPRWMKRKAYCLRYFALIQSMVQERQCHRLVADEAVPQMVVAALAFHPNCRALESMLMSSLRLMCCDRPVRIVLALQACVTRLLYHILDRHLHGVSDHSEGSKDRKQAVFSVLRTISKLSGNVGDYPNSHLAMSLSTTLLQINKRGSAEPEYIDNKSSELLRTILSRFTLANVRWLDESIRYDCKLQPLYKPWQQIELFPSEDKSYREYPHPLACCYGKARRAVLHIGNQQVDCMIRLFSNVELNERVIPVLSTGNPLEDHQSMGSAPDDALLEGEAITTSFLLDSRRESGASVSYGRKESVESGSTVLLPIDGEKKDYYAPASTEHRLKQLCRCTLALQLQDALENSLIASPHQLRCYGFSSFHDIHATIYALPPRYTVRMILRAMSMERSHPLLLSAWVRLAVVLVDVLLYHKAAGTVHGGLDLDHIFCDDDLAQELSPTFIVGPAVAIPPDILLLVPPEDQQSLYTREEFEDAASRTYHDDDSDVRRCLMEALLYGTEVADGFLMEDVMHKIPRHLADAVFGLSPPGHAAKGQSMFRVEADSLCSLLEENYQTCDDAATIPF